MPKKPLYTTSHEAETAFYEALARSDLEAMMSVWADDEEIVCIHPGGARLAGYAQVREAWRRVFENASHISIQIAALTELHNPFTAIHSLIERIETPDAAQVAWIAVTNVYVRSTLGWRMIVHHASQMPPESVIEEPKVLH